MKTERSTVENPTFAESPRLTVRVRRVPGMPMIAAKVFLRGGAWAEDIPGQALVTGRLLTEGTRHRNWRDIAEASEDLGMALTSSSTYETLYLSLEALAQDWKQALAWMAEMSLESVFVKERFEWARRQAAAELDAQLDQPETRAIYGFLHQLYGAHPYGRSLFGSRKALAELTLDHCLDYYQRTLQWGVVVIVTGDLDEDATERWTHELFASVDGIARPRPALARPVGSSEKRQGLAAGEADQAHLYTGHLTVPRHHPDGVALDLVEVILGAGAGLSGRLPERIREREGLAYSTQVATRAGSGLAPGRLVVYAGTSPATVEAAETAAREELERLVEDGITDDELEDARAYLIGRDPIQRQTAGQWADHLAEAEFYQLPSDRPEFVIEQLRALTRDDVEAAIRRTIRPSELRTTIGWPRAS